MKNYQDDILEELIERNNILAVKSSKYANKFEKDIWRVYKSNPKHILSMMSYAECWNVYARIHYEYLTEDKDTLNDVSDSIKSLIEFAIDMHELSRLEIDNLDKENPNYTMAYRDWVQFDNIFVKFLYDIQKHFVYENKGVD